jgi:diguanylate cyclase (GGDEF)-like protein
VDNENKVVKVLICDDDSQDRKLVSHYLALIPGREVAIVEAERAREIQRALERGRIDLVFMDLQMPGKSGMQWLGEIVERQLAPVVILTGHGSEEAATESFQNGATGYLPKSKLSIESLNQSINDALEKWEKQVLLRGDQEQLERLISEDSLTGLLNRRAIMKKLDEKIGKARRYGELFGIIMLDLDFFKKINDSYGHLVGDDVLEKIGEILGKRIRETDVAGRYGGEEFLIILDKADLESALIAASRIRKTVMKIKMKDHQDNSFGTTVSQGITSYMLGDTRKSIIERADVALRLAKIAGRNRVRIHELITEVDLT